jgi:predicted nucleotidyltransferase
MIQSRHESETKERTPMESIPKRGARLTPRKIRTLAAQIGHLFRPEKVLLFGSYAYGQPTHDSDVDILVIMKTRLRPVEQAVAIRQAVSVSFPMDLMVRTPEQLEKRLRLGDYFLQDIMRRGIILYEAAHT